MFDSDNEIYVSNYNSPLVQIRHSVKSQTKKVLFTPTGSHSNPYNKISKNRRKDKHTKIMKIMSSFLHKFQSVAIENDNINALTTVNKIKNKPTSFTDLIKPMLSINLNLNPYSIIQSKKFSKKTMKEIFDKIKNFQFNFDNKITFPYIYKIGNKNGLKRIVFFDIENVLLHSEQEDYLNYDKIIKIKIPSGLYVNLGIDIRPHFKEMINMIKDNYFICIYTSCEKFYADYLLDSIEDSNNIFILKLYRDKCFKINYNGENIFFKDLRIINGVNINDIIIVDSSALNFGLNFRNGIPISPYNKKNENDEELLNLGILLNDMYKKKDVGDFIESTFQSFFN